MIDLYERNVVASENAKHITSYLTIFTEERTSCSTECDPQNLILYSDQYNQFTSLKFISYCRKYGITQNMSQAGCPYNNTPMERYCNTLKEELINQYIFNTDKELDLAAQKFTYL